MLLNNKILILLSIAFILFVLYRTRYQEFINDAAHTTLSDITITSSAEDNAESTHKTDTPHIMQKIGAIVLQPMIEKRIEALKAQQETTTTVTHTDKDNPPNNTSNITVLEAHRYIDVIIGEGKEAKLGNKVSIELFIRTPEGKSIDTTKGKRSDHILQFLIGAGEVPKGLEKDIIGMKTGGKRIIILTPAELSQDSKRLRSKIEHFLLPEKETLVFEVKLLTVIN